MQFGRREREISILLLVASHNPAWKLDDGRILFISPLLDGDWWMDLRLSFISLLD